MRAMVLVGLTIGALTAMAACALAQAPASERRELAATVPLAPPKESLPSRVRGFSFNTLSLEAQRAWYETTLGFRVLRYYERDGKRVEYVMTLGDNGPLLTLGSGARPPGLNSFDHLTIEAPDATALAAWLGSRGVWTREALKDRAWQVLDPEGNMIEIITVRPAQAQEHR